MTFFEFCYKVFSSVALFRHLWKGLKGGSMARENERKFLARLRETPANAHWIRQGYIPQVDSSLAIRIREVSLGGETQYIFTFKAVVPDQPDERVEIEAPLSLEDADILWPKATAGLVEKLRKYDGPWDVDQFLVSLGWLALAELEAKPNWPDISVLPPISAWWELGPEVTGDMRFTNPALASMTPEENDALRARVEQMWANWNAVRWHNPSGDPNHP